MRCRSARARDLSREDGASAGSSRNNVGIRPPAMDGRASLVHRSAAPRPPPRPAALARRRPAPPAPPPARPSPESALPARGRGNANLPSGTYFGAPLISASHFESRRRRSSEEPYLAKSKSMSLISPSFGEWAEIGAVLFDGIWYCLFAAPIACAAGLSAQSYHFLALSGLRAPLTIDIEPIS